MTGLVVEDLCIEYPGAAGRVVDALSFDVGRGETVALAGVSGSGKTQTALAVTGLLPPEARVGGCIRFGDTELTSLSEAALRRIRGARIATVFQDPAASLNPHRRVGAQLRLVLKAHGIARGSDARRRVLDMLARAGLPDPERQARAYPHELSGGMRQRVMIAAALIARPSLVIADEPTTALDTTVQAQILALLRRVRDESGIALLLITHDLGVIAENAERLVVLDGGRLVESGPVATLLERPSAERTRELIAAVVPGKAEPRAADGSVVLTLDGLAVTYRERRAGALRSRRLDAVQPVSLKIHEAETLALVGESGCGKTSLARAIAGLVSACRGRLALRGEPLPRRLAARSPTQLAALQMVFQDPAGSLNPALRIGRSIDEPLSSLAPALSPRERRARLGEALDGAGLDAALLQRFPHQLSGGQAQRAALARALIARPALLICDEPVASLDGPLRRQVLDSLATVQRRRGLALLLISHDLAVVRQLSHRVAVMYLGHLVELAASDELFARPRHPYSRALIDAAPVLSFERDERRLLPGEPASLADPPAGCVFHPRCAFAEARCRTEKPALEQVEGTLVACHFARQLDLAAEPGVSAARRTVPRDRRPARR